MASSVRTECDADLAALEAESSAVPKSTGPPAFQAKTTQQRPRGLSTAFAMTKSDKKLKRLEPELAENATATNMKVHAASKAQAKPRAKALGKPKEKQSREATKPEDQQVKKATQPKPRKPRHPNAAARLTNTRIEEQAQPTARASVLPTAPPTRFSAQRSVASSYDSDGLDKLDKEPHAFH